MMVIFKELSVQWIIYGKKYAKTLLIPVFSLMFLCILNQLQRGQRRILVLLKGFRLLSRVVKWVKALVSLTTLLTNEQDLRNNKNFAMLEMKKHKWQIWISLKRLNMV